MSSAALDNLTPLFAAGLLHDVPTVVLLGIVIGMLGIAFGVGQFLRRQPDTVVSPVLVAMFNQRIRAWWIMCVILVAAFLTGRVATITLFGLVSFWALREFITLTPTRLGDHRTLFWVFFVLTPLQYVLIGMGLDYYGLYSVLLPVYGFLFVAARIALAGRHESTALGRPRPRRSSRRQWHLLRPF